MSGQLGSSLKQKQHKYKLWWWAICIVLFVSACAKHEATEKDFLGKWKSPKLATPLYLYANNEWEIKMDDGTVLQYGVWSYLDNKLVWTYNVGRGVEHDVDPIVSVSTKDFKVLEADKSITTFIRVE